MINLISLLINFWSIQGNGNGNDALLEYKIMKLLLSRETNYYFSLLLAKLVSLGTDVCLFMEEGMAGYIVEINNTAFLLKPPQLLPYIHV